MMPAQERLAVDLDDIQYGSFRCPVVHNVDAKSNSEAVLVAGLLTRQVSSTVRWLQSIETLAASGVDTFVEVGPGKVLTGLSKANRSGRKRPECRECGKLKKYVRNIIKGRGEKMSEVQDKIKQIIVDELGVDEAEVTENARFIEDLGADSLDLVELVMRLKRNSISKFPTRTPKRSKASATPTPTSSSTKRRSRP